MKQCSELKHRLSCKRACSEYLTASRSWARSSLLRDCNGRLYAIYALWGKGQFKVRITLLPPPKQKPPSGTNRQGQARTNPQRSGKAVYIIAPLPCYVNTWKGSFTMRTHKTTRKRMQAAALLLTGALLGALGTAALSDIEREAQTAPPQCTAPQERRAGSIRVRG